MVCFVFHGIVDSGSSVQEFCPGPQQRPGRSGRLGISSVDRAKRTKVALHSAGYGGVLNASLFRVYVLVNFAVVMEDGITSPARSFIYRNGK